MLSEGQTGFILLLLLGIALVTIGIQGNLGVTIAILFSPQEVQTVG